ncbi:E6 protein [Human papillomavirus 116]|uniref:Protein E6 n=1 Tax=Human papillomavirus 116 TaxID=915428 RepID=C7B7D2_9PAPI|nr:E6 protein [Human papillomavirus 116]ACT76412.1 E6 protein [Human papillomavirus 116]
MENPFPNDLRSYCNYFGICLFDLRLQCIFCKSILDIVDLAKFHKKELRLVWRCKVAYACCSKCLYASARYENENHFQCAVKASTLHDLLGTPLHQIYMRCNHCLSGLDLQEKFDLVARDCYVILVRGYWRGPCRDCINREY